MLKIMFSGSTKFSLPPCGSNFSSNELVFSKCLMAILLGEDEEMPHGCVDFFLTGKGW
jgi:hypothetical protein